MSDTRDLLWKAVDQAIFKSSDPDTVLAKFGASYEALRSKQSTFGGYLASIRRGRELLTAECAQCVGVSQAIWQAWEANHSIPSMLELEKIFTEMGFGERKQERLLRLREEAPRHYLRRLTKFKPEYLAARGVAKVENHLEWDVLPDELKRMLSAWGLSEGLETPDELFGYVASLDGDEQREQWIQKVLDTHA